MIHLRHIVIFFGVVLCSLIYRYQLRPILQSPTTNLAAEDNRRSLKANKNGYTRSPELGHSTSQPKIDLNSSTNPIERLNDPNSDPIPSIILCLENNFDTCLPDRDHTSVSLTIKKRIFALVLKLKSGDVSVSKEHYIISQQLIQSTSDILLEAGINLYSHIPTNRDIERDLFNAIEFTPSSKIFQYGLEALRDKSNHPELLTQFSRKIILEGSPEASLFLAKTAETLITSENVDDYLDVLSTLSRIGRGNTKTYHYLNGAITRWRSSQESS